MDIITQPPPHQLSNQPSNRILASLRPEIFEMLRPHLTNVEFKHGSVLAEPGEPISKIYFPHSGIISLVVPLSVGDMVETAMIGRDGVFQASSALDGNVALNRAVVQIAGAGSVAPIQRVADLADRFREFRALLVKHEQVLFAQAQQSSACNVSHVVEARLCRWLLRTRDLVGDNDLTITQEFLAQMLGVRRSSVSITAHTLQKAGLIKYKRGHVRVLDPAGLEESACECYQAVRGHYERLFPSAAAVANTL
jgi:CRP-like cAMP-binding protein